MTTSLATAYDLYEKIEEATITCESYVTENQVYILENIHDDNDLQNALRMGEIDPDWNFKLIGESTKASYCYCVLLFGVRDKRLESAIMKNPYMAFEYCKCFRTGRIPEVEELIKNTTPKLANDYATTVARERIPEFEDLIAESPEESLSYCWHLNLKGIDKLVDSIKTDESLLRTYRTFVDSEV